MHGRGRCLLPPARFVLALTLRPGAPAPAACRQMLQQGCPVDCADYDGRRALELAAARGHASLVRLLLEAGADPSASDALGSCPLMEAVKAGRDDVVDMLVAAGGRCAACSWPALRCALLWAASWFCGQRGLWATLHSAPGGGGPP